MASTLAQPLPAVPRKKLAKAALRGEGVRKPLADDACVAAIGEAIERALLRAEITKQQAALVMGYGDNQAPITRWIKGQETPQFAKLWMLGPRVQRELVMALAEASSGFRIERVLREQVTA